MQTNQVHPEIEQLSAFVLGKLESAQLDAVESHLAGCDTCCDTLKQIKADTFVDLVRQAQQEARESKPETPAMTDVDNAALADAGTLAHTPPAGAETGVTEPARATVLDDIPAELAHHPRYAIAELIGTGGMGAVYKAEHRLMHRQVALKVINPKFVQSKQAVERFHREFRAAARLQHPNIVHAYDAEQAGDLHFLAMEYVKGTDLQKVLEQRGPLPVAEACDYIRQAALGLQHAHESGMVHRDIKPQNLMLSSPLAPREGGRPLAEREGYIKILDFGLASLAEATVEEDAGTQQATFDSQKSGLTQAGALMGTPDYIAPEQAKDAHAADVRSDIYSLGCTLYYLLAGKVPFPGGTAIDKVIAHAGSKPQPIGELRNDVPAVVVQVLDKMMAKDPAARYQTPAHVAAALAPLSRYSGRGAGGEGERRKRRRRPLVTAALAAVFAGIVLVAGAVFYIVTDNGTIEIRFDDDKLKENEKIKVIAAGNGKTITLEDFKNKQSWTLDTGKWTLQLDGAPDGLELDVPDPFTLKRRDQKVVTIQRVKGRLPGVEFAGWVQLFNGKDLTGWTTHPTQPGDWRVDEEGNLACTSGAAGSHLFYMSKEFANFHLRATVKINQLGDGGLLFRSRYERHVQVKSSITSQPHGYEAQIRDIHVGGLIDISEGKTPAFLSEGIPVAAGTWTLLEVIADGNRITTKVNGKIVKEVISDSHTRGLIAVQHAHAKTAVHFKRIEIKELPPAAQSVVDLLKLVDLKKDSVRGDWNGTTSDANGTCVLEFPYVPPDEYDFRIEFTLLRGYQVNQFLARRDRSFSNMLGGQVGGKLFALEMVGGKAAGENPTTVERTPLRPNQRYVSIARIRNGQVSVNLDGIEIHRWKTDYSDLSLDHPVVQHWTKARRDRSLLALGTYHSEVVFHKAEVVEITGRGTFTRPPPEAPGWVQLFNGKDVTGWKTHAAQPGDWKVEGDVLVGRGPAKSHLFSVKEYENFHWTAEVKGNKNSNSGMLFRTEYGLGADGGQMPLGYETEISHRWGTTGSLIIPVPGTQEVVRKQTINNLPADEWFKQEVIAVGNHIVIKVNGKTITDYVDSARSYRRGHLALQVFEPDTVVSFKNIQIKELPPEEPGWVQLFNKKNLDGWQKQPQLPGNWRVEDGAIVGTTGSYNASHLFTERGDFSDFHLRVEAQINIVGNSGVFFRCSSPQETADRYPKGYEAQIFYGDFFPGTKTTEPNKTGSLYGKKLAADPPGKADEWFLLEVIARGKRITVKVNDTVTVDDFEDGSFTRGHIALQVMWPVSVVKFRKIEIKELPPEEPGWGQLFNGKDLTGWKADLNPRNWLVQDGAIIGKGLQPDYLSYEREYENFHLRVEAKINKGGNSGIYFRAQGGATYEAEIAAAAGHPNIGSVFQWGKPGAGSIYEETKIQTPPEEWFTLEIIANGSRIVTKVNGQKSADVIDDSHRKGVFRLQLWGGDTFVQFRKIEIKELPSEEPGWVQLFNGKDFTGWKTHPGLPGDWKVENGTLVGGGPFDSYLYTQRDDFENVHIRAECQINEGGNSGIFFRASFVAGHATGYEVQINVSHKDPIKTGSLHPHGAGLWEFKDVLVVNKAPHAVNEWFMVEVIAQGPRIMILVNGKKTIDWVDPQHRLKRGHLALQRFGPGTVARFRKIEIKELPPDEPGWVQLFNGKDLTGWRQVGGTPATWTVDNGMVRAAGSTGALISERSFTDFKLRAEVRISPGASWSLGFRADPTGLQQKKPVKRGFAADIVYKGQTNDVDGHMRMAVTPTRDGKPLANLTVNVKPNDWFPIDLTFQGDRFDINVSGGAVGASKLSGPIAPGPIILQLLDANSVLEIRKLEIMELTKTP